MREFISLARGINVGGKTLKMEKLRNIYESLKLHDIITYIQSGNVLFNSEQQEPVKIKQLIERKIKLVTGLDIIIILRIQRELEKIVKNNPFIKYGIKETEKMYVTFLEDAPSKDLITALIPPKPTKDEFKILGKEIYLYCPGGYGETVLSNNFFEKKLKIGATTRNWRTINKLYDLSVN
jgi:uncharacterized protein (DUF1697 family)